MALLDIKGLRQRFGGVTALDGADLTVEQGRITGLIGPNGAGKTTLFNAVTGALRPNDGAVRVRNTRGCSITAAGTFLVSSPASPARSRWNASAA